MEKDNSLQVAMYAGVSMALASFLVARKHEGIGVLMLGSGSMLAVMMYLQINKINSVGPVVVAGARG